MGRFYDSEFSLAGHKQFEQDPVSARAFANSGRHFPAEGKKPRDCIAHVADGMDKPTTRRDSPVLVMHPIQTPSLPERLLKLIGAY